jgi:hypothetical protein
MPSVYLQLTNQSMKNLFQWSLPETTLFELHLFRQHHLEIHSFLLDQRELLSHV